MFRRGASRRFADRDDAGHRLATALLDREVAADLVLAIPRGGVPVGRAVADGLELPLDVLVAAKIGAPANPELAIGAVGSDGTVWLDEGAIDHMRIEDSYVERERARVADAVAEKEARYRGVASPPSLDGATVLVVDDGAATGATTIAATRLAKARGAERIVVALPVAPPATIRKLEREAEDVICLLEPPSFGAVGQFYADFAPVSDETAIALLGRDD